jgi:hypothetical protein
MIGKKDLAVAFLAGCCVMALLFAVMPTRSADDPNYSPWTDLNDDGVIDSTDLGMLGTAWGSFGDPITKAGLLYDSGWLNITDKAGQNIPIIHGLNVPSWNDTGLIVDITGRTTPDESTLRYLGLTTAQGWSRTYGGGVDDYAKSIIQTGDGGYALAGNTNSFGAGGYDCYLVKTDGLGKMQWNKTYGGSSDDFALSVVQTSDGGYAVAGYTYSFGALFGDCYLVKTDASGNMQWNKTYASGDAVESAYSVVQTVDGGYALAGSIWVRFVEGDYDFYLVKTDGLGNMQWNQVYGGTAVGAKDEAYSLVQTGDGGYALAGYTNSFGAGGYDCYLVKTDGLGTMQWNKTYGGTKDDYAYSLVQTSDGGYAMAGETWAFDAGLNDVYLVKTDGLGKMQWNKTYGGTNYDYGNSIVQTSDGGYAVAGHTESYGAGGCDAYFVKTDGLGNVQWSKTYGGTEWDEAGSVVQTSDCGYAVAGNTRSFGNGGADVYFVKIDVELGLMWTDSAADTITLYRGATDPYWNYVRVRIWAIKQNP